MEANFLPIQMTKRWILVLGIISMAALFHFALLLAPPGAWYIPLGTVLSIAAVLLWVNAHDNSERLTWTNIR